MSIQKSCYRSLKLEPWSPLRTPPRCMGKNSICDGNVSLSFTVQDGHVYSEGHVHDELFNSFFMLEHNHKGNTRDIY